MVANIFLEKFYLKEKILVSKESLIQRQLNLKNFHY